MNQQHLGTVQNPLGCLGKDIADTTPLNMVSIPLFFKKRRNSFLFCFFMS